MLDGNTSHVQVVAICTVLLYIKYAITTLVGGMKKFASGNRPPEDGNSAQDGPKQDFGLHLDGDEVDKAKLEDLRWQRIVANDLENIPIGLIMAWAAVVTGGDSKRTTIAIIIFTTARFLHTLAYALAYSKARTAMYMIGLICILILGENVIAGSYN
ncbi:hypothetical protein THRCLA_00352 [Thraustotheca clavata]|uniref:Microsomal glutathione S-transferase 1 n=1 Tax=Thraustotheca clavata TaxID=74557 RepID=A0A1W0ABT7_9STRA|nr:hypothetical protein THRCLA_00352 [Thraustotheca clavata]